MASSPAAQAGTTVVARSALLALTATPSDGALALRVTRLVNHQPIVGTGKVTATLDGHPVTLTAEPNGVYLLPTHGRHGGTQPLQVVVSHDGIRELLAGTVSLPQQRSAFDALQGHGMAAWWVLNVVVVLLAVLVISRRKR